MLGLCFDVKYGPGSPPVKDHARHSKACSRPQELASDIVAASVVALHYCASNGTTVLQVLLCTCYSKVEMFFRIISDLLPTPLKCRVLSLSGSKGNV